MKKIIRIIAACAFTFGLYSAEAFSASGFFAKGTVDRISMGSSFLLVAVVDGTACLSADTVTQDSSATMAALLAAGRLAENRLGSASVVMNCDNSSIISQIRICPYGFQSTASTLCKDS